MDFLIERFVVGNSAPDVEIPIGLDELSLYNGPFGKKPYRSLDARILKENNRSLRYIRLYIHNYFVGIILKASFSKKGTKSCCRR